MARQATFSQRTGLSPLPDPIAPGEAPQLLRTTIWNRLLEVDNRSSGLDYSKVYLYHAAHVLAADVLNVPTDSLPNYDFERRDWLKERLLSSLSPHAFLDVIERLVTLHDLICRRAQRRPIDREMLIRWMNAAFEDALAPYRFVGTMLTPISNDDERKSIEAALHITESSGFNGAHAHLDSALRKLSQRPKPDARKATEEAILALESVAKRLAPDGRKAKFSQNVKWLAGKLQIHGSLTAFMLNLYGYGSDEEGVRHSIFDDPDAVRSDEARFAIIVCSATVNYLISRASACALRPDAEESAADIR